MNPKEPVFFVFLSISTHVHRSIAFIFIFCYRVYMSIKIITTQVVANYFSDNVNWDYFYSAVDTLGDSLNSPKNRFDKSDILELAVDVFSDGKVKHHNETGRDFYIPELDIFCEMKYETDLLFKSSSVLKDHNSLTLVNTMGSNDRVKLPEDYADFLLAVGSKGCAVVDKVTLEKYLDTASDSGQIKAKNIPSSNFSFVRLPNQIHNRRKISNIDYRDEKLKLQKEFLNRFKSMLDV